MRRALQTAAPMAAACAAPLRIEPGLHERKVGELCGKTHAEAAGLWTETLRNWCAGDLDFAPPWAESFLALQRRVLAVWERLAEEYAGKSLVVVTHGHVCRALLIGLLPGLSVPDWETIGPFQNASLTELVHAGGWRA